MQYLKRLISTFCIITLVTMTIAAPALSQSGRGRPTVPKPSPSASQPPPVINVPAASAVTRQEQIGGTSRFVLRNGITVIISEHHSTPIAAAVAYFKAGAQDEPWSLSAGARLVQRMVLRGTVLRPGEHAVADLRSLGASVQAAASYAGASYSVVAPSDKLKGAMGIQADMLQNSAFDAEVLRQETQALIEEHRRGGVLERELVSPSHAFSTRPVTAGGGEQALSRIDDPSAYSMARMLSIAFRGGPAPEMDAFRPLTRDQLLEFYRSHYRPENLIISVAGDVSTFNTLVEVQQLYGDFGAAPPRPAAQTGGAKEVVKPKPSSGRASATAPTQQQPVTPEASNLEKPSPPKPSFTIEQSQLRYAADRADISQSIVSVGFHVPGAESKDWPAIEVLAAVAGQGRASRFNRSIVDGQLVANRVESTYLGFAGDGLLTTQMWSAKDSREGSSIDKAESALFKELDRMRREIPSEGEMARAKSVLEKRYTDDTALYLGRACAFARAEAVGVGFRAVLDYRTRIRSVSPDDVRRAAARYFTLANTSIHEYEPFSAEARTFNSDSFATTVTAWAPGFPQPVENAAVQAADPTASIAPVSQGSDRSPERQAMLESVQPLPIKDFSTLNGPKAFVRQDHSQQTVTIAILFQGGRLIEDATTSGTTELMLRSMLYGTPRRASSQVTQELEQLGADARMVVEPDFFGFILSSLSRNGDRALKLLRDMIEDPAFRDDDIARARLGQIASIREARDSSATRSQELLLQALFAAHPYSLPPHGREEVVAALTSEKLHDWYSRAVNRQLPVAIIVGDTDGSALVSSQIAEGFKRREVDAAIQVRMPQPAAAAEKTEQRRSEQTTIAIGAAGPKAESGDLTPVSLFESAMNGEGGRLQRELRDKQSLISAAVFCDDAMFAGGMIGAYAAASPANEQRVRTALLAEFDRTARGGLPADELASARALAATSYTMLLQSQSRHALRYARAIFYRRQAADVDSFAEHAAMVTVDDIKRVAAAYLKASAVCAGIVRGNSQASVTSPPKQD